MKGLTEFNNLNESYKRPLAEDNEYAKNVLSDNKVLAEDENFFVYKKPSYLGGKPSDILKKDENGDYTMSIATSLSIIDVQGKDSFKDILLATLDNLKRGMSTRGGKLDYTRDLQSSISVKVDSGTAKNNKEMVKSIITFLENTIKKLK